jgi:DNA polymerase III delta subunit
VFSGWLQMADPVESFLSRLSRDSLLQVCLVQGDAVLAEPAARRIAQALAQGTGLSPEAVETYRRPANLASILQDLRTFSLFSPGKVSLAVDSAVFADRTAAGELIDDAAEVVPLADGGMRPLSARERQAASRLLQALYLFDVDAQAGAAEKAVGELPAWVLEGGKARRSSSKGRNKKQVEELRGALAGLLEAARREGLQGMGDSDLSELAEAIRGGLPPSHALVLAESAVAADHPVVQLLQDRGAVLSLGRVESERGSWQGLELLATELERQTGVGIAPDALTELARRTLRQENDVRGRNTGGVDSDSTARLAGEYRKLANIVQGAAGGEGERIDRKLVEQTVEDRGEEDVWQLLDAIGAGRGGEALDRLHRLIGAAEDPLAARLTFFSLLSSFCRQLVAIRGMMRVARVPAGEANYGRFKNQHAPALQGEVPIGGKNPLAGLHPFRLHRAYLAASRLPEPLLAKLPSDLLDTELQLKGESGEADVALARLVAHLSQAGRRA